MKQFILKKKDLDAFIKKLSEKGKVVAPVSKGDNNFAFVVQNFFNHIPMTLFLRRANGTMNGTLPAINAINLRDFPLY